MAARVTDAEVKEILDTDLTPLTAFITGADSIVDDLVAKYPTTTDAKAKEICRWLAAHLVTRSDPLISNLSAGNISLGYLMQGGLSLDGSPFGQTAMLIDTTGFLRRLNKGKPPMSMGIMRTSNGEYVDSASDTSLPS